MVYKDTCLLMKTLWIAILLTAFSGCAVTHLDIPETTSTHQLKYYQRIKISARTTGWIKTDIQIAEGDILLIFASGRARIRGNSVPPNSAIYIKTGGRPAFRLYYDISYYSLPHPGQIKFGIGSFGTGPDNLGTAWYRENSGSYRIDCFVVSKDNEPFLPKALKEIARKNPADEILQAQVVLFCGPPRETLNKKTNEELKILWFSTIHYSGRIEIVKELTNRRAGDALISCLQHAERINNVKQDRLSLIQALGKIGDPTAAEALIPYLSDLGADIRSQTLEALGQIKNPDSVDAIFPLLFDKEPVVRWKAVHALGEIGNPGAADRIGLLLADEDRTVRESAELVLIKLGVSEEQINDWKQKAGQLSIDEIYRTKLAYQKAEIEKQELAKKLESEKDLKIQLEASLKNKETAFGKQKNLTESLYEKERQLKSKQSQLDITRQQSAQYQAELQRLNAKVESLSAELNQAKNQAATENVKEELDKTLEAKSKLEKETKSSREKEAVLREEILGLNKLAERTRSEAEEAKQEVVALRNREKQLATQIDELKQRLNRSMAPVLVVSKPINGAKIESPNTLLHFIAVDDKGISKIEIDLNGNPIKVAHNRGLKVVSADGKFSKKVDIVEKLQLIKGQNIIKITVTDTDGMSQEEFIHITRVKARGDIWAIVIGINQYRNTRNLKYAVNDAQAFKDYLKDYVGIPKERIFYLANREATKSKIERLLGTTIKRKASKDDTVIIFYAGHGAVEPDPSNLDGDGFEKYLLPHDADLEDLYSTSISMNDIRTIFTRISAERLIFIVDTCYSGASGGRTMMATKTRANLSDKFYDRISKGKGRVIISSCSANEISKEDDKLQHGIFSYYMLEGLKGQADQDADGIITVSELFSYISRKVPEASAQDQHPVKKGETEGELVIGRVK